MATQLSLGLFDSTAIASGLTLDAGYTPARASTPPAHHGADSPVLPDALTRPATARVAEGPRGTNFRLTGDRPLARSWRGRAEDNLAAIKLLKQIGGEGGEATAEEQAALIRFIGFGASELANTCFRRPGEDGFRPGWEELGVDLEASVTPAEYAGLVRTTQYAHYTPESIVRAVWTGLERLGFNGGRILEPGIGTGLFVALMPEAVQAGSAVTGIEFDGISAGISRLLYPAATIRHEDFCRARLCGQYDLAVGNPPFSDRVVNADPAYRGRGLRLHDFFIAKAIDSLRPGGVAAFVTSTGTMDKADPGARAQIARSADLLGAIRIPAGSFRGTAGTDVVVDLLFFQRRAEDEDAKDAGWDTTVVPLSWPADAEPIAINRYWIAHPEMVLGEHRPCRGMHGPAADYTCVADPGLDLAAALETAIQRLPEALYATRRLQDGEDDPATAFEAPSRVGTAADKALLKEGSFYVGPGGGIMQILGGRPVPVPVREAGRHTGLLSKQARILRALIPVRDAVRQVLRAQAADDPWQAAQRGLRIAYGNFVRNFGPINMTRIVETRNSRTGETTESHRRPNLQPFLDDPDCWLVASIEDYDLESGRARMGSIFSGRVIAPPAAPVVVTAADALAVSLNEMGGVDPAFMSELLDRGEDAILAELGDAVFRNPETETWETADATLSGAVRTKLAVAEASAALDPHYARNVAALRAVQPEDLKPSQITARLGAPWIPAEDIAAFSAAVLTTPTSIGHHADAAAWSVDCSAFHGTAAGTTEWGTARRNAGQLLEDALNARLPQIHDTIREDGVDKRVLNTEATEAAKEKLAKIKLAFERWIWTDPDRADRLGRLYNDRFNNLVPRHFDGQHLTLSGASSAVRLYDHQKRAIWRIVTAGSTYIAHAVGAGKTFSIIGAVMEQKRLGLIAKPMLVVPGHCLAQASREFLQFYPEARILVADETNFSSDKRHRFLARAATANWDAIIITHAAFKLIAVPAAFERGLIAEEIGGYARLLVDMQDGDDRISPKRIERLKEGLEERLEALRSRKDDMLTIDEIGIDQLIVDEAQEFRKLSFATNQTTLKGVAPDGSQRAWDLWVKSRLTESRRPGRGLIMASGTPITNTLGEMFTVQRFMDMPALIARHVHQFDAWAAAFGDTRAELELQPSGLYKPVTRFAEFVNVPELVAMFRAFADVVQKEDLRALLKLPTIKGGQRQIVTTPASAAFKDYQKLLDARIRAIEERSAPPQPGDDILLSVITDGRHAAIDLRLVDAAANPDPTNKLNLMIDRVFRVWQDTASNRYTRPDGHSCEKPGAGQLIFSDLGTLAVEVTRGFSAYRWIRERLVRLGVPRPEIAFMQDFRKSEAKQRLFNDFNAGRVRILIGSSDTMGTGVNVQHRLKALHHLDVPWLPSQIEQREGRIERQGNGHDEIELYAYATLGSMDATMWQNNERKARFIAAALAGDRAIRRLEDLGASQANQFALAKALASGDQRLMQKAGLESEIARLERLRAAHFDDQHAIRRQLADAQWAITRAEARIVHTTADLALRRPGEPFAVTVAGRTLADATSGGTAVLLALRQLVTSRHAGSHVIATYRGFEIRFEGLRRFSGKYEYELDLARTERMHATQINLGFTPQAILTRLQAMVEGFETEIADARETITHEQNRLTQFEARRGGAFPLEAELAAKQAELDAIEAGLAATGRRPIEEDPLPLDDAA